MSQFINPHPNTPAEQLLQLPANAENGFHDPAGAAGPGMPVAPPFRPPSQVIDPHPIPSGDPPFAFIHPAVPFDQRAIDQSVRTPTKNLLSKTSRKTPGKRTREKAVDTPSKTPTRTSNRTRIPKKMFEIDQ
jgi:hypothetical protein